MSHGNIGLLNSVMALTAFCLQPVYGVLQDRLGFRKHLFAFVVLVGALMGPFFAFVFTPLVELDQVLGAVVGGLFLSLTLNAGVGIVETFNERKLPRTQLRIRAREAVRLGRRRPRLSRRRLHLGLEPGQHLVGRHPLRPRAGHAAAGGTHPEARRSRICGAERRRRCGRGLPRAKVDKRVLLELLRNRSFVGFMVLMFGAAALYDVFDQQFPNYFARFVAGDIDPQVLFSGIVFAQILLEALVMVAMPFVINRIGAKRGLQLFALVLVVRVVGSALFTQTSLLVLWRSLAAMRALPLMLVPS